jgi:HEAT repeat protein
MDDPRVVDALIAALDDDVQDVREKAAVALGEVGDARVADPLLAALRQEVIDGSEFAGVAMLQALRAISEPHALEGATWLLGSRSRRYRELSESILNSAGPDAAAPLVAALSSEDEAVRTAAAERLASLGEEAAAPALVEALVGDSAEARAAAAELLNGMSASAGQAAVGSAVAALQSEDTAKAVAGMHALGVLLEGPHAASAHNALGQAIAPLIAILDAEGDDRRAAAWLLARTEDAVALDALYRVGQDPDDVVRWAAMDGLLAAGDDRAADVLVAALPVETWDGFGRWVLERLTGLGERAIPSLIAGLDSGDAGRRAQIAMLLGDIGDVAAEPALVALLGDAEEDVRSSAAAALGDLGTPGSVEPLVAALGDASRRVRQVAGQSLNRLDDALLAPLLDTLEAGDLALIARTYAFYIARGETGCEDALIGALDAFGTQAMAVDYLNSDHAPLVEAAEAWAKAHGFAVVSLPSLTEGAGQWGGGD